MFERLSERQLLSAVEVRFKCRAPTQGMCLLGQRRVCENCQQYALSLRRQQSL